MTQEQRSSEEQIADMAAEWHVASSGDAMNWDGFTVWLEADPRHRIAYDQIAVMDALLDLHREALRDGVEIGGQAARAGAGSRPRWRLAFGAIAALVIAALMSPVLLHQFRDVPDATYLTVASGRTIALADGSTIALAPHSELIVSGRHEEAMRLSGGAFFSIRHDPSRALAITAGPLTISDIGTRFDVQATGDMIRLGVAEGRVSVASDALSSPIALDRGRALLFDGSAGRAEQSSIDVRHLGSWRDGRLSYDNVPLPLVADDLRRYAGVQLAVPAELRGKRFSGTLVVGDAKRTTRDLSELLGLEVVRGPGGDRLAIPAHR